MSVLDTLKIYPLKDEKLELVTFLQREHWPYHSNYESSEAMYEQLLMKENITVRI
ncbi:hypothetical protein [Geomicrobium sp. JCM 19055]|uniref:hypothetical protein n=1 Tax=Geomicrobium sp. JCM 19055 TaxID=1460649 RepID=UPI00045ED345|nr:hypothetical protein [Geomicrobium sp. JCM 19055]GAK01809.1 hypothetical protein JCM19055_5016 [Geomicrobium sp. JCM 19055]